MSAEHMKDRRSRAALETAKTGQYLKRETNCGRDASRTSAPRGRLKSVAESGAGT